MQTDDVLALAKAIEIAGFEAKWPALLREIVETDGDDVREALARVHKAVLRLPPLNGYIERADVLRVIDVEMEKAGGLT